MMNKIKPVYLLGGLILIVAAIVLATCASEKEHTNDTMDKKIVSKGIVNCMQYVAEHPDTLGIKIYWEKHYDYSVIVDTIIYKQDSSMGFVFYAIKTSIDITGKALIIYRECRDSAYALYPVGPISICSSSYEKTMNLLKDIYMNEYAEDIHPTGLPYKRNVGSPDFWENSLLFTRVTGGYYFFQTYYNYEIDGVTVNEYIPIFYPRCEKF